MKLQPKIILKKLALKFYFHKTNQLIMKVNSFKYYNLILAFFLESILFISVGNFGFNLSESMAISIFLSVILPLVAMYYWGKYQAPKSPFRLKQPHRTIFAILGFSVGATALHSTEKPVIALIFIILAFINQLILFYFEKKELKRS